MKKEAKWPVSMKSSRKFVLIRCFFFFLFFLFCLLLSCSCLLSCWKILGSWCCQLALIVWRFEVDYRRYIKQRWQVFKEGFNKKLNICQKINFQVEWKETISEENRNFVAKHIKLVRMCYLEHNNEENNQSTDEISHYTFQSSTDISINKNRSYSMKILTKVLTFKAR